MSSGKVGQAFVLTCFFTAGYGGGFSKFKTSAKRENITLLLFKQQPIAH